MKTKRLKLNKIISLILAIAIICTSFVFYGTSYAYTRPIPLNLEYSTSTDGPEDMIMLTYEPEKSGMFTMYQTSKQSLDCYLFIREENPDGSKNFKQLAFSNRSPNFKDYPGQIKVEQFCLTYHLDAGVTYYFGIVAPYPSLSKVEIKVKLINKKYDDNLISYIEAKCPATLSWYTDGEWKKDANGGQYYHYNISKIVANTEVIVHYTDGTVKSKIGASDFDGLKISYTHDQYNRHWYVERDAGNYTSNDLTVKILDKTATINVKIEESTLYPVKCRVVDYTTNEPIAGADIYLNSQSLGIKSDDNGYFSFTSSEGSYMVGIAYENSIKNETPIQVSSKYDNNDYTKSPFKLVTCDYVMDGVINTKDSAKVYNSDMAPDVKQKELAEIDTLLGADKTIYK